MRHNRIIPTGPMVYSAFYCDEEQLPMLNELGCAGNAVPS